MWARIGNTALGIWLMAAPAVLGYGGAAETSDRIAGPAIATFAIVAVSEVTRPLRRVNTVAGVWLLIAPWLLGFPPLAVWNSMVVGVLVIGMSLVRGKVESRFGGGWKPVWRGYGEGGGPAAAGLIQADPHGTGRILTTHLSEAVLAARFGEPRPGCPDPTGKVTEIIPVDDIGRSRDDVREVPATGDPQLPSPAGEAAPPRCRTGRRRVAYAGLRPIRRRRPAPQQHTRRCRPTNTAVPSAGRTSRSSRR